MNEKIKNVMSFLLRLSLSGILLFWLFRKINWPETYQVIKAANLLYIFYAFIVFCFIHVLLIIRWITFMRALELPVPTFTAIRYFFIGLFGNLFLPTAIGGDIVKVIGLCRNNTQKPKVVASVVLDRLSGFAGIVIVAIIVFILGYNVIDDHSLIIPIVLLGAGSILVTFVLFNERTYILMRRLLHGWPRITDNLMKLHYDISLLRGKAMEGWKAVGFSCLAQIFLAITLYLTVVGLNQKISLIYFLIFSPLVCVICSLPSIGGLGVREFGWVYFFSKLGVAQGIAVSMSLINFLFMVIIGLSGGVLYVATLSSGRLQHHSPDAAVKVHKS